MSVEKAQEVLDELSALGAVESTWGLPCATKQFHPIERIPRHVEMPCGQRVRVTDDGADLIRNRLDRGRPNAERRSGAGRNDLAAALSRPAMCMATA